MGWNRCPLADRDCARVWIIDNQLGRRNLNPDQFRVLLGQRYLAEKQIQGTRTDLTSGQNDPKSERTSATIARSRGVSEATVRRAAKVVQEAAGRAAKE